MPGRLSSAEITALALPANKLNGELAAAIAQCRLQALRPREVRNNEKSSTRRIGQRKRAVLLGCCGQRRALCCADNRREDAEKQRQSHIQNYRLFGFTITPRCVRPFIFTTTGTSNCRRRTHVVSSTASSSAHQSQSTKPSPTSGFTVKYPTFDAVRF